MSLEKINCAICGAQVHSIQMHLKEVDHDRDDGSLWTFDQYKEAFPDQPVLSKVAEEKLAAHLAAKASSTVAMAGAAARIEPVHGHSATVTPLHSGGPIKQAMNEVFALGTVKAAMNASGNPIMINVFPADRPFSEMVPDVDPNYVYDIENLKNAMMAIELNIPLYVWGHTGTGKTTLLEQIYARTRRPLLRVQHTINTEESHIIGQWTIRDGQTVFQPGPLALAMKHGWVYLADEYDFALASVLAVYQPILEGKSLVIKEADDAHRIIKPHPEFRFCATGNTNGCGDETGMYQGTQMQNAANYDRFGVVIEQKYMPAKLEVQVIAGQAGIPTKDAELLVDFANRVRQAFDANEMSSTISPRALINAAKLGIRRGSWRAGLNLAFINKLSKVDRAAADGLAQRVFK